MGCDCSERGHRLFATSVLVLYSAGCTLTDLSNMQGGSADAIEIASSSTSSSAGDGDVGGSGATSSASASSGGAGGAASASCTPLAGNSLLLNGDAELGPTPPPGMGNWNGWRASVAEHDTVNSGSKSLLVCKDEQTEGDGADFATWADLYPLPTDIGPGWSFAASICVRAAPGFPPPTQLTIRMHELPTLDHVGTAVTALDDQWQLLTVQGAITQSDPSVVSLMVMADSLADGTCFLVDDAVILHPVE